MLYQYRLFPTKKQISLFKAQLEEHRQLYNKCLEYKIEQYKNNKTNISSIDLINKFTKQYRKTSNAASLQQTVRRLDKAYKSFFQRKMGFPRFRAFNRFNTIQYAKHGDGCKLTNNLYIQNIGSIKINIHRPPGKIKNLSVTLRQDKMYVNVFCETFNPLNTPKGLAVGIDFGIQNTITLSSGESVKSPSIQKTYQKNLNKALRRKKYKVIGKINEKIRNKRKDFNHKLSRKIVNQFDIICLEDLKVKQIQSFSLINYKLADIAINQLKNFIIYKAESAGKHVILVNPAYTTQTCSNCGVVNKKELNERFHECSCGLKTSRDINAALVIKTLGLQSLGLKP